MRLTADDAGWLLFGWGMAALALGAAACGEQQPRRSRRLRHQRSAIGSATGIAGHAWADTQVTVGETEFKLACRLIRSAPAPTPSGRSTTATSCIRSRSPVRASTPRPPTSSPDRAPTSTSPCKDGSYDLFCPIDSHKSLGMNAEITVGAAGAATATSGAPSTTVPASSGPAVLAISRARAWTDHSRPAGRPGGRRRPAGVDGLDPPASVERRLPAPAEHRPPVPAQLHRRRGPGGGRAG